MPKFTIEYTIFVTKVVEAESLEDAEDMKYDDVPYPDVDGEIITSADVTAATVEELDDESDDESDDSNEPTAPANAEAPEGSQEWHDDWQTRT